MVDQNFDVAAYERRSREGPCFVCLIADGDVSQRAENEVIFEDDEVLVFSIVTQPSRATCWYARGATSST